jgi:hypothetical protein
MVHCENKFCFYLLSSSCPDPPTSPCGWDNINSQDPSPHVLQGALVGGPNDKDVLTDNYVACDYNAGFQSALAGSLINCSLIKIIFSLFVYLLLFEFLFQV